MAKVSLTNKEIIGLFQVLAKLDPGQDAQTRTKSAFNFKAKVSYALARNFKKLRTVVDELEQLRVETFKKYRTSETEERLTGDAEKKFIAEFGEVLDEKVEVEVYTIQIEDLELDKNHINIDVLSALLDTILVGELT